MAKPLGREITDEIFRLDAEGLSKSEIGRRVGRHRLVVTRVLNRTTYHCESCDTTILVTNQSGLCADCKKKQEDIARQEKRLLRETKPTYIPVEVDSRKLPKEKIDEMSLYVEKGWSAPRISRVVGVSPLTVYKYFPEVKRGKRSNTSVVKLPQPRTDRQVHMYLIAEEDSTAIKIGSTVDVRERLVELQIGNPRKITLLHVFEGQGHLETLVHHSMDDKWIRGEWFDFEGIDDAVKFVDSILYKIVSGQEEPTPAKPVYMNRRWTKEDSEAAERELDKLLESRKVLDEQ